ncbi:hypothetical protein CKO25_08100 [Thiocapsa imhoffii]|uniref:Inner membrane protein YgaP-like transmembrane domain-containing protein n=1 Tax=Thiocapsa imhoffii TaxID=382777 RepID=A0A9X0WHD1_9GAMM|nr:DUF2892 domain-containing protein [Thiocapsa imhoffii]MBK1644610.1 hypothetical protein [Thiocapsa imhoffii]
MNLPKNVGKTDRNIRLAVGGLLVLLGLLVAPTGAKVLLTIIGLVVLATGFTGTCLAYVPLKMDTTKNDAPGS